MSVPLSFDLSLPASPEVALAQVTDALKAEGFGILTRIDVHDTLRDKLGVSFRPYLILGACNPQLAHRALSARAEVGLLLPCTVTLEERPDGGSQVRIGNPDAMLALGGLTGDPAVAAVAGEARARLERVALALGGG